MTQVSHFWQQYINPQGFVNNLIIYEERCDHVAEHELDQFSQTDM